jgi:hypothetical protein
MKKAITLIVLFFYLTSSQAQLIFNEHDPIQTWKTINQITEDAQGNIFVAAQDSYLKYDGSSWTELQVTGFSLGELISIAAVDDNNIWIGTEDDGLMQYDGTTWTQHTKANTMLPDDQVNDIKIAPNGDVWVATDEGVVAISGTTWTVYDNPNSTLATYGVTDIEFASNGDIWFANHFNAARLSGGTWMTWDVYDITNSFGSFFIDLAIASNGDIYAGTSAGMVIYNGSSWAETIYNNSSLSFSQVNSISVGQGDRVWMGISNEGLRVHDIATDTPIGIFENNGTGVPTYNLLTIFTASNNAVWIAGVNGGMSEIIDIILPPTISSTTTDILCNGETNGSINLDVSGGIPPFTYTWSDSSLSGSMLTDLPAGIYEVTVTDSTSQTISETFTILEPQALTGTTTTTAEQNTNGNGSAVVNVNGGVSPYTYLWNDPNNQSTAEAINLSAGDYTVVVTDANGCTLEETVTVDMVIVPLTLTSAKTDILCNGDATGSITLSVDGGAIPYTYTWSDNSLSGSMLTNLPAGNYEVTVTDNVGIALSETFMIQEPPVLEGTTLSTPEEDTNGNGAAMVSVNGGVSPYTYLWNDSNNQTTAEATNLSAGDYVVTITDANGCTLEETETVDMVTDINHISEEEINVRISPNPTLNYFNIEVEGMGNEILLTILSVEGKLMQEQNLGKGGRQTIYVNDMNSGFYFIKIQDENGKVYSEKIVIGK